MALGFVYLAAVVDWFSRKVLCWRLSITLETEIFNTDQGGHFTSIAFTNLLLKHKIALSMGGKRSW